MKTLVRNFAFTAIVLSFALLALSGCSFSTDEGQVALPSQDDSEVANVPGGDEESSADLTESDDTDTTETDNSSSDSQGSAVDNSVSNVKIYTAKLNDATEGTVYKKPLQATGGSGSYVWEITGLPDGLHLTDCDQNNQTTFTGSKACIEGTPSDKATDSDVTITATDASDSTNSATKTLAMKVKGKTQPVVNNGNDTGKFSKLIDKLNGGNKSARTDVLAPHSDTGYTAPGYSLTLKSTLKQSGSDFTVSYKFKDLIESSPKWKTPENSAITLALQTSSSDNTGAKYTFTLSSSSGSETCTVSSGNENDDCTIDGVYMKVQAIGQKLILTVNKFMAKFIDENTDPHAELQLVIDDANGSNVVKQVIKFVAKYPDEYITDFTTSAPCSGACKGSAQGSITVILSGETCDENSCNGHRFGDSTDTDTLDVTLKDIKGIYIGIVPLQGIDYVSISSKYWTASLPHALACNARDCPAFGNSQYLQYYDDATQYLNGYDPGAPNPRLTIWKRNKVN